MRDVGGVEVELGVGFDCRTGKQAQGSSLEARLLAAEPGVWSRERDDKSCLELVGFKVL